MSSVEAAVEFLESRIKSVEVCKKSLISRRTSRQIVRAAEFLAGDGHVGRVESNAWRDALIPRMPADPLLRGSRPNALQEIDVFMPMHEKDSWTAHLAVAALERGVMHPIRSVWLCVPDGVSLPSWVESYSVDIVRDSELLRRGFGRAIPDDLGMGYLRQMALKLIAAATSDIPVLIQCSDTILLRPRVWIDGGVQTLPVRRKSPQNFHRHSAKFLGQESAVRHASSTTHHQLMQPELVRKIFGEPGAMRTQFEQWFRIEDDAAPCEYQVYGSFLRMTQPRGWTPAAWGHANGTVKWSAVRELLPLDPLEATAVLAELRIRHEELFGLSVHVRG